MTAVPPPYLKPITPGPVPAPQYDSLGQIIYPEHDGNPMTWTTLHYNWLTFFKDGFELLFLAREDVFVAGDLLWYPTEGRPDIRVGPDVMVAYGRPKGQRSSYRQWEEGGIAPQIVVEVLSCGNTVKEMLDKQRMYDEWGVQEYYIFDPEDVSLRIYCRDSASRFKAVTDANGWTSPLAGITFWLDKSAELYVVNADGSRWLNLEERQAKYAAEHERAEEQTRRAEEQTRRAEEQTRLAEEMATLTERLSAKLRELGVDPDKL